MSLIEAQKSRSAASSGKRVRELSEEVPVSGAPLESCKHRAKVVGLSTNRKGPNVEKAIEILDRIMQYELAGVVRYTHYSLMVKGPNRMPLVAFMKAQAVESLTHAQAAGEIVTGLDGHPSLEIAPVEAHSSVLNSIRVFALPLA